LSEIRYVKKRDGRRERFDRKRIEAAIERCLFETGEKLDTGKLTDEVVSELEGEPHVEEIQNKVVEVLSRYSPKASRAYSIYRNEKEKVRKDLGVKLTMNALILLRERYLRNETPSEMFRRVAKHVAGAEKKYGTWSREIEEDFYNMMASLEFLPNSPTLFNAGTRIGALSACYVLPVRDSLKSIFTAVRDTAIVLKTGGGVGFDFSEIRPRGDVVSSTGGTSSGPVSFMKVFDVTAEVVKSGGRRRGAMMGVLSISHPDIFEFIECKRSGGFENFNISVAVTDKFMRCIEMDSEFHLINTRTGSASSVNARKIWRKIVFNAWRSGDPGLIFIDEINRKNPVPGEKIHATNPCGEVPLLPYESCNLGSINLVKMLKGKRIDWKKLSKTVRNAVRFLDDVIEASRFPLKKIEKKTKENRKIGLGVMGFAEMLALMEIPYDSEKALNVAERLMRFISEEARKVSEELGEERGSFPNFEKSIWYGRYSEMRNATVTAIAPTGSISIIAGCSSGIEPVFALCFVRNVLGGKKLIEVNPVFERVAKEKGFYSASLMKELAKKGSLSGIEDVPDDVKRIFVTALEIEPEWHVRMQAAFQKYVDNSVSKTVNLRANESVDTVDRVFRLAYKLGCKGITVYRYGSKRKQVFTMGAFVCADSEYSGGCPVC